MRSTYPASERVVPYFIHLRMGHRSEHAMNRRSLFGGLMISFLVLGAALAIGLVPGRARSPSPAVGAIDEAEHARTVEALRAPKRTRPAIAIVTLNDATEITDFLSAFGVLARSNAADVVVVAERAEPVRLDPLSLAPVRLYAATLWIEPHMTMRDFEERYPDGADYVVVPAIEPRDAASVTAWIVAQRRRGATIVSVCNGALTLAAAGLLDGREATSHWSGVPSLLEAHPTMRWIRDRRYVVDDGIMTSTGISATLPVMVTLVEAIAGRAEAQKVAAELGLAHWDARHRTSDFELTLEHRKTFLRNLITFWRHQRLGMPVQAGVDEIALGLGVDAYSRTGLVDLVTLNADGAPVRSKYGLTIRPEAPASASHVGGVLPPPPSERPAQAIDRVLADIAASYGSPTAELVALVMEYRWSSSAAASAR